MQLRHVPCCGATLNKLRGHAHYGVKLTAVVDNHTVSSAVQEVYVTQGVPYQPRDIAITVDAGGNQTLLTWKQDYANYVLYYNVALRMRDKVHQANTVQPRCRFDFAPDVNTSLEINVSAVNAYGSSELQVMFHVSSGDKNVTVSSPAPGIAPGKQVSIKFTTFRLLEWQFPVGSVIDNSSCFKGATHIMRVL